MKISQSPSPSRPTGPSSSGGAARPASSAGTGAASSTGSTASADPSARLSQLETQFAQADFNAPKVSEVSAAIASGQYKVDAGAIADRLISSAAELAGARN
jgi:negative regulator of flagellin synthesis FlgM